MKGIVIEWKAELARASYNLSNPRKLSSLLILAVCDELKGMM
jgi:hypothetical protein